MRGVIWLLYSAVSLLSPAFGANFSFVGAFHQDDERRQFTFTLAQPATVVMRTWSYAGGANSAGVQIEAGGFDPSLSLFDSSGLLIALNRDGGCGKVASDPVTSWCWDAFLSTPLPGGTYQLVLTESENTPQGPSLADPFVYDGLGDFTADPAGSALPGFWDFTPDRRNSSYAVDIYSIDSAELPLTPAVGSLVNGASWQAGPVGPNTILTFFYGGVPGAQQMRVLIDNSSVSVLYNSPTQLNFLVPSSVKPAASTLLQITSSGDLLLASPLQIVDASPAMFTVNQSGSGQASILNQNFVENGALGAALPAQRGSIVMAYGTGFGVANPPGHDGLSWLSGAVTATIGGLPAEVTFAGLAPGYTPGLQQINIRLPDNSPTGAAVPIRLQVGGHATQVGTTVAVQ